jgi:hypothetical protein
MKPAVIAVVVALAFAGGILAGGALLAGGSSSTTVVGPAVAPATTPGAGKGLQVTYGAPGGQTPGPSAPSTGPKQDPQAPGTTSKPSNGPGYVIDERPPTPPAPPSPEALKVGERVKEDLARETDGQGNGRVTQLVEPATPEEKAAHEERKRASWAARLAHEREIKVRTMREKVGITAAQEGRLVEILEAEGKERQRLVDALTATTISRIEFDEGVQKNVQEARAKLRDLLTPEQLTAYEALDPREQVLRLETH